MKNGGEIAQIYPLVNVMGQQRWKWWGQYRGSNVALACAVKLSKRFTHLGSHSRGSGVNVCNVHLYRCILIYRNENCSIGSEKKLQSFCCNSTL